MTRTAQDIVQLAWDVLQRHSRSQEYYADARINIATLSCPFGGKEPFPHALLITTAPPDIVSPCHESFTRLVDFIVRMGDEPGFAADGLLAEFAEDETSGTRTVGRIDYYREGLWCEHLAMLAAEGDSEGVL
jgi:hypothetical protein